MGATVASDLRRCQVGTCFSGVCHHGPMGGLGRWLSVAALLAVIAACGSSTTQSGGDVPIVQIRSLGIVGDLATVSFDASDGAIPLDIPVAAGARHLTIVTTDGGNTNAFDWVVLGDPTIEITTTPTPREVQPSPSEN